MLDQKKILAEELQHRVRNNMQLVYGMLSKQLADTPDQAGQRGIRAIARRVTTLAQVYDHLLGNEITRTTDFGSYAASLCHSLAEIQGVSDAAVTLTCDSTLVMLDLDAVTALGIILAELVTNSYDHAFPDGTGSISVAVRGPAGDDSMATMTSPRQRPGVRYEDRQQAARIGPGTAAGRAGPRDRNFGFPSLLVLDHPVSIRRVMHSLLIQIPDCTAAWRLLARTGHRTLCRFQTFRDVGRVNNITQSRSARLPGILREADTC